MITTVTGKNFKGLKNFAQPLEGKTLFLGANGSGKSARIQALTLAVNGYIPGGAKQNAEILSAFCLNGDSMTVGFCIKGYTFERIFQKKNGIVNQVPVVNGKKVSKEVFARTLGEVGNPKIIDLHEFNEFSDQKKLNFIYDLYPPGPEFSKLLADIDKENARKNVLEKDVRDFTTLSAKITESKSKIVLPSLTLAQVKEEISKTEKELAEAREDHAKAREENAARVAKERKAEEEKEAPPAKMAETLKKVSAGLSEKVAEIQSSKTYPVTGGGSRVEPVLAGVPQEEIVTAIFPQTEKTPVSESGILMADRIKEDAETSIQAIIKALQSAGCGSCAALLVAKRELKKFRKEEAA